MPSQTIVLIEKFSFSVMFRIAEEATHQGYNVILMVPDTFSSTQTVHHPFSMRYIHDWTTAGLEAQLQLIEQEHKVIGIGTVLGFFTGSGLLGAQVAQFCAQRGLAHIPVAALFRANNKFMMRQTLQKQGIYTVRFAMVRDESSLTTAAVEVGFPLILKPVIGLGSSFVSRCHNMDDMCRVFKHYQEKVKQGYYAHFFSPHDIDSEHFEPLHEMLAEEVIDGHEISVECLCTEDQEFPLIIHDKIDMSQEAYCSFENLLVTPPVRLSAAEQDKVYSYTAKLLGALGLRNCFCHVELCFDSLGRPSVIEVNPRIGGLLIRNSFQSMRGIHYESVFIQQLLGKAIQLPAAPKTTGYHAMLAIFSPHSGMLNEIRGLEAARQLPGMLDITAMVPSGAKIGGDFEECFLVGAWFHRETIEEIHAVNQTVKALVEIDVTH